MKIVVVSIVLLVLFIVKEVSRKKNQANKIIHIDPDKCTKCKVCIKKCRRDVLAMVNDENGAHIAIQNPQNCTACNDCVRNCKFNALSLIDRTVIQITK
ncbi:MAG: ferredoxin family protein [Sphingobacteriia bacterium]|nr:ferredoxin family protein [Sphingobacteriia bacterium]